MDPQYRWDDFVLDVANFRLDRSGQPLPLEPKALHLLIFLVRHPDRLVTKQEIFDAVWPQTAVTDHALTRVIAQLRRALGDEAREARFIETVPTRGYRWIRPLFDTEAVSGASGAAGASAGGADVWYARAPQAPVAPLAPLAPLAPVGPLARGTRVFRAAVVALAASVASLAAYTLRDGVDAGTNVAAAHDVEWAVQLTTRNGLDLHPSFSPQGDALAYANDRTGAFEIYVRAIGGAATDTPLTSDGGQNVQPTWSPDGRFIAFHSYSRGGVWLVSARGGVPRQLAARGSRPAWSRDGSSIAFQSDEHADVTPSAWVAQVGSTLWRVDVETSVLTQLTFAGRPQGGHAAPAWSADGRFIAFTVFDAGDDNGAWLLDVKNGATRPLSKGTGIFELAFAPDGTALYASGGEAYIMRLPFDATTGTTTARPVLQPIGGVPGVRGLAVAPDGRSLVFGGISSSSHIWAQHLERDGTPTGAPLALTSDTSRRNSLAIISPDGSRIAYRSTRGGAAPDVWVMDADGGNPRPITFDRESASKPAWMRWMSDSRRLLYLAARNGTVGMWSIDVTTGRAELLHKYGGAEEVVRQRLGEMQVSPSGKQLVLSLLTPPDGRKRLFVSPVDRIAPQPLTDTGAESVAYPVWSPDERSIAVELKDAGFTHAAIVDPGSGAMRQLTDARGHIWIRSWSPDGQALAAAVLRDGRWSLKAIDATSGRERVILGPLPPHVYVRYPEWSPQGSVIVFERGELRGNIWSLRIR